MSFYGRAYYTYDKANYVKFSYLTVAQYEALETKAADTLYFVYEQDKQSAKVYLGTKLLLTNYSPVDDMFLSQLQDVLINENLNSKDILIYDQQQLKWINVPIKNAIENFVGATETSNGVAGLVPVPKIGFQKNHFLKANGDWSIITSDDVQTTIVEEGTTKIKPLTAVISDLQARIEAGGGGHNGENIIQSVSNNFIISDTKELDLHPVFLKRVSDLEKQLVWQKFNEGE